MQYKIYITLSLAPPEDPEWEDCGHPTPEDALDFLVAELTYRVGHMPAGLVLETEIN